MSGIEKTDKYGRFQATGLVGHSPIRQRGMTGMGFILLALFIGLFAFAGLRLTPIYLNYMKVAGVLDGALKEFEGQNPTRAAIRTSIVRRFDVESVDIITARDVKVTAQNSGYVVEAVYEHSTPFIANVSFQVAFDKKVTIHR